MNCPINHSVSTHHQHHQHHRHPQHQPMIVMSLSLQSIHFRLFYQEIYPGIYPALYSVNPGGVWRREIFGSTALWQGSWPWFRLPSPNLSSSSIHPSSFHHPPPSTVHSPTHPTYPPPSLNCGWESVTSLASTEKITQSNPPMPWNPPFPFPQPSGGCMCFAVQSTLYGVSSCSLVYK